MNISSLSLRGFRSYKSGNFEFSPGVNIVCGPNARGKTNLLEGIYMLSGAYSWRSRKRAELVNFGKPRGFDKRQGKLQGQGI